MLSHPSFTETASIEDFGSYPTDRLRFEYEKRQREIGILQTELSDLKREESQINDDWNEASSNLETADDYRNFDAGGYQSGLANVSNQMVEVSGRITELRAELNAIDALLKSR